MKNPHRFYDLKELVPADIGFAWGCPLKERGGCLGYPDPACNGYRISGWPKSVHPTPHVLDVALARAIREEPEPTVSRHHTEVLSQPNAS